MATYTGKPVTLPRPIGQIYEKVSDLSQYRELVEQLPEQQRQQLSGVSFEGDTIRMDAPSIGQITFRVSQRTAPTHVGFTAEGCPVPLNLDINLKEENPEATVLIPAIKIEIPPMLRPFIGNKIQQAADKFGEVFTSLFR